MYLVLHVTNSSPGSVSPTPTAVTPAGAAAAVQEPSRGVSFTRVHHFSLEDAGKLFAGGKVAVTMYPVLHVTNSSPGSVSPTPTVVTPAGAVAAVQELSRGVSLTRGPDCNTEDAAKLFAGNVTMYPVLHVTNLSRGSVSPTRTVVTPAGAVAAVQEPLRGVSFTRVPHFSSVGFGFKIQLPLVFRV